jgi:AraC family transcriptional regulator
VSTGFVYLRPLNVVAARAKGPYAKSAPAAWAEMFAWLTERGILKNIGTGYGLLLDDPRRVSANRCRYEACVELIDEARGFIPDSLTIRRLPGGAYVRQRHVGGVVGLSHTISKLRNEWVPSQGVMIDTRRPVIEIYLDHPDNVPVEKQRIDICMPVTAMEMAGQSAA